MSYIVESKVFETRQNGPLYYESAALTAELQARVIAHPTLKEFDWDNANRQIGDGPLAGQASAAFVVSTGSGRFTLISSF